MNTKIVLIVDGGLIREIIANGLVEVLTLDCDIEGRAQESLRQIPQGHLPPAQRYVRFEEVTVDGPRLAKLWKAASSRAPGKSTPGLNDNSVRLADCGEAE